MRADPGVSGVGCSWLSRVGEVEDRAADQRHRPIRTDVAQPHSDEALRAVGRDREPHPRLAEQLERLAQRLAGEAQRAGVVLALVAREVGRVGIGQPRSGVDTDGLRAAVRERRRLTRR